MVKSKTKDQSPLTKGDFDEAMQMIAKAFEKVATKDDVKRLDERLSRVERVQENILKMLDSIEGRLREMSDHEKRIANFEKKIFELESQLQRVKQ